MQRYGEQQDHFILEVIDEAAPNDQEDMRLMAFRAAYLEIIASRKPSDDLNERRLQRSWSKIGPQGSNCLVALRDGMEWTAALLRGYSENTTGDSRIVSVFPTEYIDAEGVAIMEAINDPALAWARRREQLGGAALEIAEEIESYLSRAPGVDGEVFQSELDGLLHEADAA